MNRTLQRSIQVLVLFVVAGVVAAAAVLAWIQFAPRRVPEGQAALSRVEADSLPAIRNAFNAAEGEVRILALLSPT